DAVRKWLRDRHGEICALADVQIVSVPDANPVVRFSNSLSVTPPLLSISHSNGYACALAIDSDRGMRPGVDCELVRAVDNELPGFILTADELQLISAADNDSFIRVWAAKEACYKAGGGDTIREYLVESIDVDNETVELRGRNDERYVAFAQKRDDLFIAFCFAKS
ncbi:MAG: 4'-phosphopantetheinyl transferase superfamily protein, partial [Cyanobacteria bacterium]|nr:4'-phosphopantetheinyl transferase superfamily protein [Cyanobacteriota bacterium]